MSPYSLVPLATCLVTGALAAAILARDPAQARNRLAALLVGGATVWSFFEVLWNAHSDPVVVLRLVRASAFGWVWIGPLTLHLFLELTGQGMPLARRRLPHLYGISALFLVLSWFTPWIFTGVERTSWGWAFRLGTAAVVNLGFDAHRAGARRGHDARTARAAAPAMNQLGAAALVDFHLDAVPAARRTCRIHDPGAARTAALAMNQLGAATLVDFHLDAVLDARRPCRVDDSRRTAALAVDQFGAAAPVHLDFGAQGDFQIEAIVRAGNGTGSTALAVTGPLTVAAARPLTRFARHHVQRGQRSNVGALADDPGMTGGRRKAERRSDCNKQDFPGLQHSLHSSSSVDRFGRLTAHSRAELSCISGGSRPF